MSLAIAAAIFYGILALIGGIVGYLKAKSQVSLLSGILCGLVLIIGGILQWQGYPWGLTVAAVVAALLVVVFTLRLVKTRKFMPAGLMLIAGILALAFILPPLVS